jgi:hypothetical protein
MKYINNKMVDNENDNDNDNNIPWGAEVVDTPRDGSCFFSSIAIAMNDSLDVWCSEEELRVKMEEHWEDFHRVTGQTLDKVTSDLVRFMCSKNVDDNILEAYNQEAAFRRNSLGNKNAKIFKTTEDLGKYMRKKSTWGDQASLHAFLKSLDFVCGIVIFDAGIGGIVRLPEEWTKDKKVYICLRREASHYNVVRLCRTDTNTRLNMCVTRECIIGLLCDVYGVESLADVDGIPIF